MPLCRRKLTGKVKAVLDPCVRRVYLDLLGDAAYSMQVSDCHWLRLMESPTNSTFFPFSTLNKAAPLNLYGHRIYVLTTYIHLNTNQKSYCNKGYLGNEQPLGFHVYLR